MDGRTSLRDCLLAALAAACVAVAAALMLPTVVIADRLVEDAAVGALSPPRPQSRDIAIVAITEDTLATLPHRAPIDRAFLASTIAALRAAEIRALGVDVLIDQPSRPEADAALKAALRAPGPPVVLLTAAEATPLTERQRAFHESFLDGMTVGHGNLAADRLDGVVRRHVPRLDGLPSFPAALAEAAGVGATVPAGMFRIAWRQAGADAAPPFPIYPAEAVPLLPHDWLAGRIVILGVVSPALDRHATPVAGRGGSTAGVVIQAHVLSQMLSGEDHPRLPAWAWALVCVLAALAGGSLVAAAPPPALLAAGAAAGAAGLWIGAAGLYRAGGPLVSPLAPSLAWLMAISAAAALAAWRERVAKAMLMGLFTSHLSAPVARQIWEQRDTFLQGGRPRPQSLTATVMFTDIADFTPISEQLGPERLMAWLEDYLEAMTDIIVGHDGIVLRFIGDGILAIFGAPIPRTDPAAIAQDACRAVRAALAMEAALDALAARWADNGLPPAAVRVGIVTGPMTAGSVGAFRHLEYTVMGDTVNTAARLEALAKTVEPPPGSRCRILVAQSTHDRVAEIVDSACIGDIALKGKARPLPVYQVLGPAETAGAQTSGSRPARAASASASTTVM
ncbi:CHASE2 domain-containing protein [Caenispirillum salinarum]|uniref:CHASE2 domain-containing protein n=1 Tax=Caenispirillum salinarum TaxID=859058 RepID=UPI00384D3AC3